MTTETVENAEVESDDDAASVLSGLSASVATKIEHRSSKVVDAVVERFVIQEINRRTDALFDAIVEFNKLKDEFKKFKPDVLTQVILNKREKEIAKALTGDFGPLLSSKEITFTISVWKS